MSRSRSPRRPPRARFPLRTRFSWAAVPYWIGVLLVAGVTTAAVAALFGRAVEAEARYGRTQPVAVAREALAPGDRVEPAVVTVEEWPVALVPEGALAAVPEGRTVVEDIVEGEPVLGRRLSGGDAQGAGALIPPGHRAVAVPLLVDGLPLRLGDRVDLLATPGGGDPSAVPSGEARFPPAATDDAAEAVEVATGGIVVAVSEGSVTVAVPSDDAPDVALAITSGTVVVALTGPPG